MGEYRYNNRKLDKRNFTFIDHMVNKAVSICFFSFFGTLILGIWLDFPDIVGKLFLTNIIFFVFSAFYARIKFMKRVNGENMYHDKYSEVVKTNENELLTIKNEEK